MWILHLTPTGSPLQPPMAPARGRVDRGHDPVVCHLGGVAPATRSAARGRAQPVGPRRRNAGRPAGRAWCPGRPQRPRVRARRRLAAGPVPPFSGRRATPAAVAGAIVVVPAPGVRARWPSTPPTTTRCLLAVAVGGFMALVPIAAGLSIARYHLYDVERILSRAVAYLLVSTLLALTFATVVVTAGRFFGDRGDGSSVPAVLGTLGRGAGRGAGVPRLPGGRGPALRPAAVRRARPGARFRPRAGARHHSGGGAPASAARPDPRGRLLDRGPPPISAPGRRRADPGSRPDRGTPPGPRRSRGSGSTPTLSTADSPRRCARRPRPSWRTRCCRPGSASSWSRCASPAHGSPPPT